MQHPSFSAEPFTFLQDAGEMGQLTRQYDWSQTPCGPIHTWPFSLRTTLGILLHSSFPMFLFWGDEGTCFYNDAFRPSLGSEGKHPGILGMPAAAAWPETWHFIGPLIEQVKRDGKAVSFEDQLLPIYRNGKLEDVYWTFSYSPAYDDTGNIGGVFVTSVETTENIRNLQRTQESEAKYRSLFETMNQGFCVIELQFNEEGNPVDYLFLEANPLFERHTGLKDAVGKTARQLAPGLEDVWFHTYGKVALTGQPVHFSESSETMGRWFEVNAFRLGGKESKKVAVLFTDVSERKKAELALQQNKELLQTIFDASQSSIVLLEPVADTTGAIQDFNFLMVNQYTTHTTGRTDLVGLLYTEAFPHVKPTGIFTQFKQVMDTGVPADFESWYDGDGMRYWFRFTAIKVGPFLTVTTENITQRKQSEEAIRQSEQRFQNLIRDATVGIVVLTGADMKVEIVNEAYGRLINLKPEDLLGKALFSVIPEAADYYLPLLQKVLHTGEPVYLLDSPYSVTTNGRLVEGFLNVVYQPYRNEQGIIVGVMAIISDVTEQVRSRKELEKSEHRFRSLIAEAPVATCLYTGAELKIEVVNETMLQYWGKDKSVVGATFDQALPELAEQGFSQQIREAFATGKTLEILNAPARLFKNFKWETQYFDYTFKPIFNSADQVYGIINTAVDVTIKVLAAQQVAENLRQLLASFNDMPVGLALINGNDRTYTIANPFYSQLMGSNPDELVGKPLVDLLPEIAGQDFDRQLQQVIETGEPLVARSAQVALERAGKLESIYIDFTFHPHRDASGAITGVLLVVVDVTEQALTQQKIEAEVAARTRELAEANQMLERNNRELEQFAYVASHDLQEPLRKVATFNNMLQTHLGSVDERATMLFHRVDAATRRMSALIRDILEYSGLSGQEPVMEAVNLGTLIGDLLQDFELVIEQKGAQVTFHKLPTLWAIPLQMRQLFGNLLSNAFKFTRPGVQPFITVAARPLAEGERTAYPALLPAQAYTVISIQDNGIGFSPEYEEKIFSIFQRLHGKEEYSGTGIGLALCRKITQNHHGVIWAKGRPGEGAIFHIVLPLAPDAAGIN